MAVNNSSIPNGITKRESSELNTPFDMNKFSKDVLDALSKLQTKSDSQIKSLDSYLDKKGKISAKETEATISMLELLNNLKEQGATQQEIDKRRHELELRIRKETLEETRKLKEQEKEESEKERLSIAENFRKNTETVLNKNNQSIKGALLGPLNLLTSPLEQFIGKDFIGDKIKHFFIGKPSKKSPTATDVQKIGVAGAGYLFIANTITKIWGKGKDKKEKEGFLKNIGESGIVKTLGGSILKGMFKDPSALLGKDGKISLLKTLTASGWGGKNLSKAGAMASGALSVASIVGGVGMGVKDAQLATKQNWKDDAGKELSKGAKGFGGFLGGVGSGFEGAFSNMGKWAMTGFGIGNLIFPGIGGIIGGAIGGLLGGILGYIGGEKIAKFGQKVGDFFKDIIWEKGLKVFGLGVAHFFTNTIPNLWSKFVDGVKNVYNKVKNKTIEGWMRTKEFAKNIGTSVINFMSKSINTISDKSKKLFEGGKFIASNAFEGIKNIFTHAFDNVSWDKDMGVFDNLKNIVTTVFNNIKNGVLDFFENNPLGQILDKYIISPIKNAFSKISNVFEYISEGFKGGVVEGFKHIAGFFDGKKKDGKLSSYEEWVQSQEIIDVEDAVIKPDGTIVKTNPNDTLVALKDIDTSVNYMKSVDDKIDTTYTNSNFEQKLDIMIKIMTQLLNKEPVRLQLPPQTRSDLDLIMRGELI